MPPNAGFRLSGGLNAIVSVAPVSPLGTAPAEAEPVWPAAEVLPASAAAACRQRQGGGEGRRAGR